MKPIMIIGIVLIVLGVMVLLMQFITLTTRVEGMHIGPFRTSADATTTFPVSPILGGVVLASGIALSIIGRKSKSKSKA